MHSLFRLVFFYFTAKVLRKKKNFFSVIPILITEIEFTQSSFIPAHQINHKTVDIINVRSLIYTKKLKTFSQPVKSLNLWKKISIFAFTPLRYEVRKKKLTNKFALISNLLNQCGPFSTVFPAIAYVFTHLCIYSLRLLD